MIEQRRRLDTVLDPDYVEGLEGVTLEDLRSRRSVADEVETELSYYRRLLHGRMDLLHFEQRRRSGTETRTLIEALPEILGANETVGGSGGGRMTQTLAPELPDVGRREIDRVLEADFLTRLPSLTDAEVEEALTSLEEVEQEISRHRRAVQRVFDLLQAEIAARYRDGRAQPTLA